MVGRGCQRWPILLLLVGLLLSAGCRDSSQESRKEAADAKAAAAQLELKLAQAVREISDQRAELKAVRQTRDELQEQVDQISGERDEALTLARQAKNAIAQLTTQADGRIAATADLEQQIAELKALVKDQQAIIEEIQKGSAAQSLEAEIPVDTTVDETMPADVNEIQ